MGRHVQLRRAWPALAAAVALSAPLAVASPAGSAPTCPGANQVPTESTLDDAADTVLCLVNRERERRGRRALRASGELGLAARRHSRDMVDRRFFSHDSPGGRDVVDRVMAANWASRRSAWRLGENIAWGTGSLSTPRHIFGMWMASRGHRDNILDGRFREAGIGVAGGAPIRWRGRAATYTMDFGAKG
jgi:uncharacterized protein YkwD